MEEAFKNLKGDLGLRPLYHQLEHRIEAHIFIAFVAYCLQVTLRRRLRDLAPGLTPRAVLEKFRALQMIDVHVPTSDGRTLVLPRYTQPETDLQLLLEAAQAALTRPATTPDHRLWPLGQVGLCSEDFWDACLDLEALTTHVPLESANPG